MPEHPDVTRLRAEYDRRAHDVSQSDRYSPHSPANLFTIQQRQRSVLGCLRDTGFAPLNNKRILELGCGTGGVLLDVLGLGAEVGHLHGAELLFSRVKRAYHKLPSPSFTCSDGQNLPYTSHSFEICMQFTVFSSILDDDVKRNVARELLRVTCRNGMILWYDFWLNPINPQTRGIRSPEIRRLFPDCEFHFNRITLAPPLTRNLATYSWGLCLFLESLKIFNTHYLVAIRPVHEKCF